MSSETKSIQTAIFAGGCFWCMEQPFAETEGVLSVTSGYTGGLKPNPTYHEVCSGTTGHYEAIRIEYDSARISFDALLDIFWHQIDPTDAEGQFADRGSQYRTAIFYQDDTQKKEAEESKKRLELSGILPSPVATKILPATDFYKAEEYHQDYYRKCPLPYKMYKTGSGRQKYIDSMWKKR